MQRKPWASRGCLSLTTCYVTLAPGLLDCTLGLGLQSPKAAVVLAFQPQDHAASSARRAGKGKC